MVRGDPKDDVFDALANEYRRRLLTQLLEDGRYYVPELTGVAEEIAEAHDSLLRKHVDGSREIGGTDVRLLRIHRKHLPKLEENDFIDWHRDTQAVTPGHRFDQLRPYLELLDDSRENGPAEQASRISNR